MIGLDPITLSSILILVGNSVACPAHSPTKINVIPRTAKVRYNYNQTLKQIQAYKTDTIDPYKFHGKTVTQGFMKGEIELRHKVSFGKAVEGLYGSGCIWYDTIDVQINIDPQIVIAKEMYSDSCMRKAIIEHELKHVRVDREIVNKYAKIIGKRLYEGLKSRGFSVGPIEASRIPEVHEKMRRVVNQILELEYKKLGIERKERQRAVDSLDEYERVDALCPAFQKRKKALYRKVID